MYDCIIIGGGASGLMLAAQLNISGLIIEKTEKIGAKLLLTGGGRCNITHSGSVKDFPRAYGEAASFVRRCLYRHNNLDLINWLQEHGVRTCDEGGRIFPVSMMARDVRNAFAAEAGRNGWDIRTGSAVTELVRGDGSWTAVTEAGSYEAKNIVIATGGITYPETGSDGSMFAVLEKLGLEITDLRPALTQIQVEDYPYADLSGISLKGVTVTVYGSDAATTCKGKSARTTGDLLFTYDGFSGPAVLNVSKYAEEGEAIRIKYNKTLEELPKRLRKALEDRSRGESGDIRTNKLKALLDEDMFTVSGFDSHGMVTAGGVELGQVSSATMEALGYEGLYIIGEALNADGISGGYNLQLCWSTAAAAADAMRASI